VGPQLGGRVRTSSCCRCLASTRRARSSDRLIWSMVPTSVTSATRQQQAMVQTEIEQCFGQHTAQNGEGSMRKVSAASMPLLQRHELLLR